MLRAIHKLIGFLPLFALGIATVATAQEDISYRQGRFEVFYSAFNTSFISPDVAKAAGIVRAKNKGLLNISAIEHRVDEDGKGTTRPVELQRVEVTIYDLVHRIPVTFKEIVEPSARYYLGVFKIANDNEFKQFEVRVVPVGSNEPIAFTFKRRLYID